MDTRRDFIYVDDLIDVVYRCVVDGKGSGHLPRLLGLGLLDQGALRRDRRGARDRARGGGRGAPARRGRRLHDPARSLADPARTSAGSRRRRSTEGVASAIAYYDEYGIEQTFTHLKVPASERPALKARRALVRRRGRLRRLATSSAGCSTMGAGTVTVVDNLLSAERENLPDDERVEFVEGSITDDDVLAGLPDDVRLRLPPRHLPRQPELDGRPARRPREQHADDAEALRAHQGLRARSSGSSTRRPAARSPRRPSTRPTPTSEDAPVSLWLDSPYQISKIIGEFYSNYYFSQHGLPVVKARFQNVYGPGEVLGAGRWRGTPNTVWRNVTPTFIYRSLKGEALPVENGGIASRDFIYVDDIVAGLIACAAQRRGRGRLQPGQRRRDDDPASWPRRVNELTGNPTPIALTPGARLGPLRQALR